MANSEVRSFLNQSLTILSFLCVLVLYPLLNVVERVCDRGIVRRDPKFLRVECSLMRKPGKVQPIFWRRNASLAYHTTTKNKGIETDKITEDISKVKEELDDITDSIKRDL